jgi:hypothetical protein
VKERNSYAEPPTLRRLAGAALFGIGCGLADARPGPIVAQVGEGIVRRLCTLIGVVVGAYLPYSAIIPNRSLARGKERSHGFSAP